MDFPGLENPLRAQKALRPRGLRSLGENCALELRSARAFCQRQKPAQNFLLGANLGIFQLLLEATAGQKSPTGCKSWPKPAAASSSSWSGIPDWVQILISF